MNKKSILDKLIAALTANLEILVNAARASHAEATHESSKPENKYDTRGLEAAYLAGGQARQAKETMDAIKAYQALKLRDFTANDLVDLTALVTVEINKVANVFFIGPNSGGLEVQLGKTEITVLTPQSPLALQLLDKKAGDQWQKSDGKNVIQYRIVSVK